MILEPLITVYVLKMGVSKSSASLSSGIIFSAVGIATVIMAPKWGKWGRRIGYKKVLFIGLIGGGIGNLLQFFVTNYIGFGILRFSYGLFFAAVFPSINAMIVKTTEPEFRGETQLEPVSRPDGNDGRTYSWRFTWRMDADPLDICYKRQLIGSIRIVVQNEEIAEGHGYG